MTKVEKLISAMAKSSKFGKGVFSKAELAYLLNVEQTPRFNKFLYDCVKKGTINRIANGLFESTITPPNPRTAIYEVARKLRPGYLNYISLESELSRTGEISQIIMDRLTLMTRGRSGTFKTRYGVVEFTHTKHKVSQLENDLFFDEEVKMYRAMPHRALADLKSCKRNLQMINH
ncbi:MAG: type IV toxin-antitoxin system AbiEi family antitoxin [Vibrio toranzoniae]|jgi:hypothetical protein|uniref:type IV toxin-antitoxin system AbiEi family antitoxin n=1 Tax=Vibrio toranzoniae TaxID=1194427 RepID=UPI001377211A|nr:hypothetical protein [Vibrio toranzoniae]NAZ71909.1 hypothetical protein [Vibrio toranzoniae]